MLDQLPYLFIDLQATGASPRHGRLLELGWSRGEAVSAYLVDPGQAIPRQVSRITGIEAAMMTDALPAAKALQLLREQLSPETVLVAHVSRYEMSFLEPLWLEHLGEAWRCPVLCTHQIAQRLLPTLPSLSLRAVAGHFGFPAERARRACDHVQATVAVWRGLCKLLAADTTVRTLADLQEWLAQPRPSNKRPRVYPMARDVRLKLPASAGIYRMRDLSGRVLYVGKALSLKSRVNSYFRQRRGHAVAKLEMLAQVVAIDVQTVASGLEAALLEADEIKRLDPPYNTALRAVDRPCIYLSHDLSPAPADEPAGALLGPFPYAESALFPAVLAKAMASDAAAAVLAQGLREAEGSALTTAAVGLFAKEHRLTQPSPRSLLALGVWLVRAAAAKAKAADSDPEAEEEVSDPAPAADKEAPLTAEHMVERIAEHLQAAARALLRARKVQRLLNSDVTWHEPGSKRARHLKVRAGQIVTACWADDAAAAVQLAVEVQAALPEDRATYDRMRTLLTELNRVGSATVVLCS